MSWVGLRRSPGGKLKTYLPWVPGAREAGKPGLQWHPSPSPFLPPLPQSSTLTTTTTLPAQGQSKASRRSAKERLLAAWPKSSTAGNRPDLPTPTDPWQNTYTPQRTCSHDVQIQSETSRFVLRTRVLAGSDSVKIDPSTDPEDGPVVDSEDRRNLALRSSQND